MNNWLAFSLSPQELPSQTQNHESSNVSRLGFNSDEISGTDVFGDCFDLASDSTDPSLNLPSMRPDGPFGILEAFNRSHQNHDWNVKDLGMNCDTNYKTSSEYSMLMGGSSTNHHQHLDLEEPKLEDFLGGNSFSDHDQQKLHDCNTMTYSYDNSGDYMFSNCSLQLPAVTSNNKTNGSGGGGGRGSSNGGSVNNNSHSHKRMAFFSPPAGTFSVPTTATGTHHLSVKKGANIEKRQTNHVFPSLS